MGMVRVNIYGFFMHALPPSYTLRRSLLMDAAILTYKRPEEMKKMTTVAAIDEIGRSLASRSTTPVQQSLLRWNARLFVSGVVGAVSGIGGLTIGFLTLLELVVPSTTLYTVGTLLIGTSFILFGLAAHCIDKADAADKALRLEYCREHGLQDKDGYGVRNAR